MLKDYDKEVHPSGDSVRVYRVKVVISFLKAGVPLDKIDCFRDILEEFNSKSRKILKTRLMESFYLLYLMG